MALSQAGSQAKSMVANSAARSGEGASAQSNPALAAKRHARSLESIPKGRAEFDPTGTNWTLGSLDMGARIDARNRAGKWPKGD
ncbi:MAG TPA: hypothetical protein VJ597_06105 [Sphingomicrobium sp.]|nr:hypothetical protein [Sphingomicrobium sp.]